MAGGGEGAPARRRPCRIKLEVLSIESQTPIKEPHLTFKLEEIQESLRDISLSTKSESEAQRSIPVNRNFVFDVENWTKAELKIKLSVRHYGIQWEFGKIKPLKISDFFNSPKNESEQIKYYQFWKDDEITSAKIKLRLSIVESGQERKINLFIGTWNLGNAEPQKDIKSWLNFDKDYELIAIGAQEFVYLPIADYEKNIEDWIKILQRHIGSDYELLIKPKYAWQLILCVFIRKDIKDNVSEILSDDEATGLGHVIPNKGAVCISLKFLDTSICFIVSHFAAHEGYCEERNKNYQEIVSELRLAKDGTDVLHQSHYLFWFGDLNYRLDFPPEFVKGFHQGLSEHSSFSCISDVSKSTSEKEIPEKVIDDKFKDPAKPELKTLVSESENQSHTLTTHIENLGTNEGSERKHKDIIKDRIHNFIVDQINKNEFKDLYDKYDELKREMKNKNVFYGFVEGDVKFPPTFRMERNFETKYNTKRFPAFCDRILYRHFPGYEVKQLFYKSFPSVKSSDHKPVSSAFELFTRSFPVRHLQGAEKIETTFSVDDIWMIEAEYIKGTITGSKFKDDYPDPYVKFFGSIVHKSVSTKVIQKSINPLWKKDDIPHILLKNTLDRLKYEFLHFQLFYKDFSYPRSLGFGMIPLLSLVENIENKSNEFVDLESDIVLEGLPSGKIQIKARLSLAPKSELVENPVISNREVDVIASKLNESQLNESKKESPVLSTNPRVEVEAHVKSEAFFSASNSLAEDYYDAPLEVDANLGASIAEKLMKVEDKQKDDDKHVTEGNENKQVKGLEGGELKKAETVKEIELNL